MTMLCKSKKEANAQKKECCLFCFPCSLLLLLLSHIWVYLHKIREITRKVGWVGWLAWFVCPTVMSHGSRATPKATRAASRDQDSRKEMGAKWMGMCCVLSCSLSVCLSDCPSLSVCLFVCLGLLATRNKCHLILMANVCATVGKPQTTWIWANRAYAQCQP